MPDLDAIRAWHVPGPCIIPGHTHAACQSDRTDWPCDTAIVLAALDQSDRAYPLAIALTQQTLDAALARERRLRAALDDHWPEAGTEPDDTPTLSCSCGWDSEPWRKRSLNWPEHIRAALAETPEAGS